MNFKKRSAETFGTFWLVFGGCGSAVLAAAFPGVGIGLHGVALAFGLTVLTMGACNWTDLRLSLNCCDVRSCSRRTFFI